MNEEPTITQGATDPPERTPVPSPDADQLDRIERRLELHGRLLIEQANVLTVVRTQLDRFGPMLDQLHNGAAGKLLRLGRGKTGDT